MDGKEVDGRRIEVREDRYAARDDRGGSSRRDYDDRGSYRSRNDDRGRSRNEPPSRRSGKTWILN
jgi:hypothetical protein